jgi:uncharacterized membrane protein
MKKLNLILGVVCIVITLGLTYANLTLPPESIWFDIGYGNWPWAPPVIFAVVGIILVATSKRAEEKFVEEASRPAPVIDTEKAALNKRLETVFWGLFLIMLGGQWLLPKDTLPNGLWSILVGLLLLGLNGARYFNHLRMSGFTTFLGILSVIGGVGEMIFKADLDGAILLIILGSILILKPWFDKQGLFGKAEEN